MKALSVGPTGVCWAVDQKEHCLNWILISHLIFLTKYWNYQFQHLTNIETFCWKDTVWRRLGAKSSNPIGSKWQSVTGEDRGREKLKVVFFTCLHYHQVDSLTSQWVRLGSGEFLLKMRWILSSFIRFFKTIRLFIKLFRLFTEMVLMVCLEMQMDLHPRTLTFRYHRLLQKKLSWLISQ